MNSTSPITFPLNITCIITGYGINEQTTVQWKADGNILANNTDDTVFYRVDVSNSKAIVTLVVKRAICLGSLQIKLVATQLLNGNPVTSVLREIMLNSSKFSSPSWPFNWPLRILAAVTVDIPIPSPMNRMTFLALFVLRFRLADS